MTPSLISQTRHATRWALVLGVLILVSISAEIRAQDGPSGMRNFRADVGAQAPGTRLQATIAILAEGAEALPSAITDKIAVIAREFGTRTPKITAQGYRGLWFIDFGAPLSTADFESAVRILHSAPGVRFASEVRNYEGIPLIPSPELLIILERGASKGVVLERLSSIGADLLDEYPGLTPILHVSLPGNGIESHSYAQDIAAWSEVRSAEVNFIEHLSSLSVPNDPLFPSQWALKNTAQNPGWVVGADLNAPLAWDLTTGSTAVKIAILDEGIDFTHPDLAPRLGLGYEATDQLSPANTPGNALLDDEHGTACAGIAAAAGNNGIGIAGVCWSATLMPVRIGYADHWSEVAWQVDAITWATDQGADVLSNSWGGGPPSSAIQASLGYSLAVGRNGLGCLLIFAAGNTNGPVVYPAKYPEAIAVGASSPCDERKSPTSCDGETTWGSCHGLEIDLVAPGVKLVTTDIVGPTGRDPGDYIQEFNGTSAACPYVAGAAGLLLSSLPNLTATQARAMLTSACLDQVGAPTEDTPGWDQFMGWGRLDLRTLLDFASAPDPVASLDCTIATNDVTLSWTVSSTYDSFEISRGGAFVGTVAGTALTFTETAVAAGSHRYEVVGTVAGADSPRAVCTAFISNGATDLVWSPPDAAGAINGGARLVEALLANGRAVIEVGDIAAGGNLDLFDRIWVNLGIPPSNHVLTEAEAAPLVTYLTNGIGGRSLYLEGGDVWAFDPPTSLHPQFRIDGFFDGFNDLDVITGLDIGAADFSFIALPYGGENSFIDQLAPLAPAVSLLRNGPNSIYDVAIYHEDPQFRTIGASFEFGGLFNTTVTRNDVMAAMIDLLTVPSVPFMRGDGNGSGTVNLADVVLTLSYLFNGSSVSCLDALDANDNGSLNLADAVYTLQFLFSGGTAPALPFPAVDIDPTGLDPLDCAQYP